MDAIILTEVVRGVRPYIVAMHPSIGLRCAIEVFSEQRKKTRGRRWKRFGIVVHPSQRQNAAFG